MPRRWYFSIQKAYAVCTLSPLPYTYTLEPVCRVRGMALRSGGARESRGSHDLHASHESAGNNRHVSHDPSCVHCAQLHSSFFVLPSTGLNVVSRRSLTLPGSVGYYGAFPTRLLYKNSAAARPPYRSAIIDHQSHARLHMVSVVTSLLSREPHENTVKAGNAKDVQEPPRLCDPWG